MNSVKIHFIVMNREENPHWTTSTNFISLIRKLSAFANFSIFLAHSKLTVFHRDLMLAGTQQSVELKLALDQEQQKSKKLEESMRKLDDEMRRTDELLYQMIPKQVADRLRKGENPIDTCEVAFDVNPVGINCTLTPSAIYEHILFKICSMMFEIKTKIGRGS